jgi:Uma2 family endonuclease
MEMLARFLVSEYWIVDPATDLFEIYVLRRFAYELAGTYDANQEISSPTLPGLTFASSRVFAQ